MSKGRFAVATAAVMVIAVVAIGATAGGAAAQVDKFEIGDGEITTDDGTIDALSVSGSGDYSFDGLDGEADSVEVTLEVKNPDGTWSTIKSQSVGASGHAGSFSGSMGGEVLSNSQWDVNQVASGTDGDNKATSFKFRLSIDVVDSNGNVLASDDATNKATLTVQNEAVSTGVSADGTISADGENQSP